MPVSCAMLAAKSCCCGRCSCAHVPHRLATLNPLPCPALLVRRELRLAAHLHATRLSPLRPSLVRGRINPRSNSAKPNSRQAVPRPSSNSAAADYLGRSAPRPHPPVCAVTRIAFGTRHSRPMAAASPPPPSTGPHASGMPTPERRSPGSRWTQPLPRSPFTPAPSPSAIGSAASMSSTRTNS